jgi:hypothetical protein
MGNRKNVSAYAKGPALFPFMKKKRDLLKFLGFGNRKLVSG